MQSPGDHRSTPFPYRQTGTARRPRRCKGLCLGDPVDRCPRTPHHVTQRMLRDSAGLPRRPGCFGPPGQWESSIRLCVPRSFGKLVQPVARSFVCLLARWHGAAAFSAARCERRSDGEGGALVDAAEGDGTRRIVSSRASSLTSSMGLPSTKRLASSILVRDHDDRYGRCAVMRANAAHRSGRPSHQKRCASHGGNGT